MQGITPELRRWIVEQARAGCRPDEVLRAMTGSGWREETAIRALEEALESYVAQERGRRFGQATEALPHIDAITSGPVIRLADREVRLAAAMALPRVVVIEDLLSRDECEAMIDAARARLVRSETVASETGDSEVNSARTSEGMFFGRSENELCTRIEARIAELVSWPVERGEGLQVLRYGVGAEYRPHYDYFDPAQPGTPAVLRRGGQRIATLVIYLNTPLQGGATVFPEVGLEVAPVQGNAVFFSYPQPSTSTRTLHGGAPVLAGEKWVATKWLRQAEFD